MAIFTGKIIEAYYTNSENSAVEVIYNSGDKAINHYLAVDFNNQDFKDLIAEYDTDKIGEATVARNRKYAKQLHDIVNEGIKAKTDVKEKISTEDFVKKLLTYDPADDGCREIFFTMKVQTFELQKVKDSGDDQVKDNLRNAKTPLELLACLARIDD